MIKCYQCIHQRHLDFQYGWCWIYGKIVTLGEVANCDMFEYNVEVDG